MQQYVSYFFVFLAGLIVGGTGLLLAGFAGRLADSRSLDVLVKASQPLSAIVAIFALIFATLVGVEQSSQPRRQDTRNYILDARLKGVNDAISNAETLNWLLFIVKNDQSTLEFYERDLNDNQSKFLNGLFVINSYFRSTIECVDDGICDSSVAERMLCRDYISVQLVIKNLGTDEFGLKDWRGRSLVVISPAGFRMSSVAELLLHADRYSIFCKIPPEERLKSVKSIEIGYSAPK